MTFVEQVKNASNEGCKKIGEYLLTRDDLKEKLENPKKTLEECFIYCASQYIKESFEIKGANLNFNGDTDEAVYGHAVHYYDEDDIKIDPRLFTNVRVDSKVRNSKNKGVNKIATKTHKKENKSKISEGQMSLDELFG